uniref:Alkylmercury lyase n=1 Tax=Mycobacterium riyadhense TaxID=486698 RepID=A0A653EYZ4_9MYCO|nr:Alkylmercury lyase [Mycobacterium riyadhense]
MPATAPTPARALRCLQLITTLRGLWLTLREIRALTLPSLSRPDHVLAGMLRASRRRTTDRIAALQAILARIDAYERDHHAELTGQRPLWDEPGKSLTLIPGTGATVVCTSPTTKGRSPYPMNENTVAARLIDKLLGAPDNPGNDAKSHLMRVAVQLLADGDPITPAQLAAAAGVTEIELERAIVGKDIEYDDRGRIVGWGLTSSPTPHKFAVDGRQFYTWSAPDTLIFPAVIARAAQVESSCPTTGTTIRLTIDPDTGITALEPSTAVVSIVDPSRVDADAVRATVCDPQRFFATADAARDWQSRYPGMTVLSVAEAYTQIMRPLATAVLADHPPRRCC